MAEARGRRRAAGWRWISGAVLAAAILAVVARVIGASWEGTAWRMLGLPVVCLIGGAMTEAVRSFSAWRPERRAGEAPHGPDRPQ